MCVCVQFATDVSKVYSTRRYDFGIPPAVGDAARCRELKQIRRMASAEQKVWHVFLPRVAGSP